LETQKAGTSDINITAKGSLEFVLTSAHNPEDADLDLSNLENRNNGYELSLETPLNPLAKEKINEVLANFAEATDHQVFYGTEPAEVLILSVSNLELLKKHVYESSNGVESNVSRINESIKSNGKLSKLIQVLNKKVLPIPLEAEIADDLDEMMFTIEMNWSDGFEQAYEELEKTYGLRINKESRMRKVLRIE